MATRMKNLAVTTGKFEIRTNEDGSYTAEGLAIPYNSWSQSIGGYFKERFLPGSFKDDLATNREVVCTVDHDYKRILGTRSRGKLKLDDREDGLYVVCDLPDTTYANDLRANIKHESYRGMSFTFIPEKDTWEYDSEPRQRTVEKAELYEVCFTWNPAYLATTAALRTLPGDYADPETLGLQLPPQQPNIDRTLQLKMMQLICKNY